ncbi:unnamed protein product [Prorocentrum cordatum]|uniref:Integrase catalytic domain-containing protein n=1 Tax=Prorocentrum cordatum TaxID=2364126 RepID=A0ABN9UTC9_9DINO|nr:unnamed protein product [Polarella glacialis]
MSEAGHALAPGGAEDANGLGEPEASQQTLSAMSIEDFGRLVKAMGSLATALDNQLQNGEVGARARGEIRRVRYMAIGGESSTACKGWPDYQLWKRKIFRWERATDVATEKRADRVLKQLDADLQRKLECITDEQLTNPEGVQHKHDDERRRTARECLFQYQKKPAESLTSFASWLDFQFDRIATHGLAMPDEWKALFLEEGAGLDDASLRLIRVLTTGDSSHAATPAAIRELDISKKETMTGTRRTRMTQPPGESELASQTSQTEAEDGLLSCDGASSLDTDTEYALLDVMEQKDFNEADAPIAPATTQADRRKTRRQNRELKRKLKTDRRYFQRSAPDREARLPLSEIIKRPRCSLRQQKGHGGDKCPNKDGPTASGARGGQRATSGARGSHQGPPLTGFSYPNGQEEVFLMGAQMPRSTKETALVASKSIDSCTQKELALQAAKGSCPGGLRVPAGAAVLDTAAGQGLVGKDNLAELSSHLGRLGYAAEHAAARRALAGGVVGKTGAPTTAPIPTGIEKAHGAFEVGAIEKGIPLFVTVFLLTALGAVVDLPKKRARLSKLNCTTELFSIPPGHPRFWIDRLKGPREFQRPGRLAQQLPELKADSFRQPVQSVGVYEVGNDDLGGGDPATIDDPTTDRHDDEQTRRTGKPEAEFAGKYVLTENLILERIPQSSRTWAFFTSTPMSTACTLSREPRNMLATNRLFTLKTRKVDCGPTKEQLICRHPAMEISSGANLHGRRWNCEARGQRTAHRTAGELRGAAMKRKRGIVFSFAIFEAIPEPKPARGENFAALMKAHIEQLNTLKAQQQNTDQMMLENRQAMERTMGVSQAQGPTIQSMDKSKWELIHDQEKPRAAAGPELDQEDPAIVDPTPEQVSSTQAKAQRFFFELEPVWSDTADGRRAFLFWRAGWAHAILGDTANDDFEVTIPKNMPEQTLASSKGDVENTETAGADIEDPAEKPIEISARIKEMIGRVHANLDHSRAEIFTHVPRAAQARPEVLQGVWGHVKCDAQRMTAEHRQAASPRTFQFSGIVAVDTFFVPFLSEVVPYLGAKVAWRATMETWIRYVGPPDALITDGGPEFQGEFEHGSEAKGAELPFQPEVRELIRDAQRHGSIKFGAHRSEKHQTKCAPAGPGAVSAFEPPDADEWKATFETKAPSTFGGEVLALSGTVAGAERFQTLFLDVTQGGLLTEHWRDKVGPFTAFLKHDRELNVAPLSNFNIVDAKGIFDTLSKETSGSKADRRIALDLSVIRSVMTRVGSQIRWVPHPAMPVDSLSKSDIQKGDWHLLCHFLVSLLQSTHFHVPYVIEMWGAGQAQGRPVRPRVFGAAGRAPMSGCPGFGPPLDSVTLRTGRGEGPPWSQLRKLAIMYHHHPDPGWAWPGPRGGVQLLAPDQPSSVLWTLLDSAPRLPLVERWAPRPLWEWTPRCWAPQEGPLPAGQAPLVERWAPRPLWEWLRRCWEPLAPPQPPLVWGAVPPGRVPLVERWAPRSLWECGPHGAERPSLGGWSFGTGRRWWSGRRHQKQSCCGAQPGEPGRLPAGRGPGYGGCNWSAAEQRYACRKACAICPRDPAHARVAADSKRISARRSGACLRQVYVGNVQYSERNFARTRHQHDHRRCPEPRRGLAELSGGREGRRGRRGRGELYLRGHLPVQGQVGGRAGRRVEDARGCRQAGAECGARARARQVPDDLPGFPRVRQAVQGGVLAAGASWVQPPRGQWGGTSTDHCLWSSSGHQVDYAHGKVRDHI